ncbi:DUF2059 domain-containing protein [Sphingomonas sp.]|uniref:DUF2059 domain-containing protein n=1 Tax=Sphingomonas sp. TaxID=28214 RepID=UPI003CC60D24
MKRIVATLASVATLFSAIPAAAQKAPPTVTVAPDTDPARVAAATRLIALMHLDATLDRLFAQLTPVFAQGVIGALSGDESGRTLLAALDAKPDGRERFSAILSQEYLASIRRRYPEIERGAAAEYAAAFTREELEAIAAFYSSGAGAKLLRLQPELQQRMSARGQGLGRVAGAEAGERAVTRATREILGRTDRPAT